VTSPANETSGGERLFTAWPSGRSKTKKAMATALMAKSAKAFQGTRRWIVRRAS
jgi:hypothetical protein